MFNSWVGYDNIVPVLASVDMAGTVTTTDYVNLKGAHHVAFLVNLGLVTGTATDREEITVEAATAPDGAEAQIDFYYRQSGAVGTNTWTAITSASIISIDPATDSYLVWIELDPGDLAASDYNYVRLKFTDNPDMTAALAGVVAFVDARYKQTTFNSVTASASA